MVSVPSQLLAPNTCRPSAAMASTRNVGALAAWPDNAGENAVLRYKGIPPYNETQDYVRKVMTFRKHYTPKEIKVVTPKLAVAPSLLPNPVGDQAVVVAPVVAVGVLPTVTVQNQL